MSMCLSVVRKALVALVLAIGLKSPVLAEDVGDRMQIMSTSTKGAILVKVEATSAPYRLVLRKEGQTGFGSRIYSIMIKPGRRESVFAHEKLEPGRYVLEYLAVQNSWVFPLTRESFIVAVEAGKVSFLGRLNVEEMLVSLHSQTVAANKVTLPVGTGWAADQGDVVPKLSDRDDQGLAQATSYAANAGLAHRDSVKLATIMPWQAASD
jgi:hypothetical protein